MIGYTVKSAELNLPVGLVESDDKDRNWKFLLGEYCRIIINESIPTMKKRVTDGYASYTRGEVLLIS